MRTFIEQIDKAGKSTTPCKQNRSKTLMVTSDQPEVPAYFPSDVEMNRVGECTLAKLKRSKTMNSHEVSCGMSRGAILLDTRYGDLYSYAHIKGALNIGLGGHLRPGQVL